MIKIMGKIIKCTRGDTLRVRISPLKDADGNPYHIADTDTIVFAVKKDYGDESVELIHYVVADHESLIVDIPATETKKLKMGETYVYDVSLTTADGYVDTFIDRGTLQITEEVG